MVSVYNINGGLICSDLILRRNNHHSLSNTNNLSLTLAFVTCVMIHRYLHRKGYHLRSISGEMKGYL